VDLSGHKPLVKKNLMEVDGDESDTSISSLRETVKFGEYSDYVDGDYSGDEDPSAAVSLQNERIVREKFVLDLEEDCSSVLDDTVEGEEILSSVYLLSAF
jgi:hypothetical protein